MKGWAKKQKLEIFVTKKGLSPNHIKQTPTKQNSRIIFPLRIRTSLDIFFRLSLFVS